MVPNVTSLLATGTPQEFQDVLKLYPEALEVVKERAKNKKTIKELDQLDKWYQEELGSSVLSRQPPHLTQDELVRLMTWKLTRGKFRPSLVGLVKSNSEEVVKDATSDGIKAATGNKFKAAVTALTVLRGVGPATASAILAAVVPQHFSFYADEVAASILALQVHKYQLKDYEILNSEMVQLANRLNCDAKKEVKGEKWTAHRVELAVWTYYLLYNNNQDVLTSADIFTTREAQEEEEEKEIRREKIASRNGKVEKQEENEEKEEDNEKEKKEEGAGERMLSQKRKSSDGKGRSKKPKKV